MDLVRHPDDVPVPPAVGHLPHQETGVRPARAVPYTLQTHGQLDASSGSFRIDFRNSGRAGAVFQVRSGDPAEPPRTYTVEPNKHVVDDWSVDATGKYDLSVYGPNGCFRLFKGAILATHNTNVEVRAIYEEDGDSISDPAMSGLLTCRAAGGKVSPLSTRPCVVQPQPDRRRRVRRQPDRSVNRRIRRTGSRGLRAPRTRRRRCRTAD